MNRIAVVGMMSFSCLLLAAGCTDREDGAAKAQGPPETRPQDQTTGPGPPERPAQTTRRFELTPLERIVDLTADELEQVFGNSTTTAPGEQEPAEQKRREIQKDRLDAYRAVLPLYSQTEERRTP